MREGSAAKCKNLMRDHPSLALGAEVRPLFEHRRRGYWLINEIRHQPPFCRPVKAARHGRPHLKGQGSFRSSPAVNIVLPPRLR